MGKIKPCNEEDKKEQEIKRNECAYLGRVSNALELTILVIFAFNHVASVKLATLQLHRHKVTCCLVKRLHRNPQTSAHLFPTPRNLKPSLIPKAIVFCSCKKLNLRVPPLR
ncbi:hypothetical protein SUGI_0008490 [Cryptomeria japonica]|nr:hypothetical protein SUGI_0008490 [Cryptomeria japonica]